MTDAMIALDAKDVEAAEIVAGLGLARLGLGPKAQAAVDEHDLVMNAAMGAVRLLMIHALAEGVSPDAVVEGVMRSLGEAAAETPAAQLAPVIDLLVSTFRQGAVEGRANDAADVAGHA